MLKKISLSFFLFLFFFLLFVPSSKAASQVNVHLFYSNGCPHCKAERQFLSSLEEKYSWLEITEYEVSSSLENSLLFSSTAKKLNAQTTAVPFTVICDTYFVGYSEPLNSQITSLLIEKNQNGCTDVVASQVVSATPSPKPSSPAQVQIPDTLSVPLIGEIKTKNFSLPLITFTIALIDGFNPCAMWTLLFLISLLLGMKDRTRMWTIGSVFIFTSGFVYFLFLTAWLQVFLFLGFVFWIRIAIAIAALSIGGYYLYDYQTNKSGACKVTGNEKRRKTFDRLREITLQKNFLLSLVGIILLAIAVNMVELVCSAGLPAIYTQILSISSTPPLTRYLYLIFYIIIFMLDDMLVFIVAMITLHSTGLSTKYARTSHLIGAIVMFIISLLLLFKPEILMFG
jgi:hypothetical protein